ncbi:MAG: hypothetical protein P8I74_06720 [Phycisphaerales bacterium]|nr:hypothetical protein [Phycisphaerales bacterium]
MIGLLADLKTRLPSGPSVDESSAIRIWTAPAEDWPETALLPKELDPSANPANPIIARAGFNCRRLRLNIVITPLSTLAISSCAAA